MRSIHKLFLVVGLLASTVFSGTTGDFAAAFGSSAGAREAISYHAPAAAFVRGDTVFLGFPASTPCPTCVGCACNSRFQAVDSFPLAPGLRGIPLQYVVSSSVNDSLIHFLVLGGGHTVLRRSFRLYGNPGDYTSGLRRSDSLTLLLNGASSAMNNALTLYGVDSLSVDAGGMWHFRAFGNQGLRVAAYAASGTATSVSSSSNSRGGDSLTIISAGSGLYGTLNGYVLDPSAGYANPVRVAQQPILLVNDSAAAGDNGLFVLREASQWRAFKLDTIPVREFHVTRSPYPNVWTGTRATLWDNRSNARSLLVKDDSTVWQGSETTHIYGQDSPGAGGSVTLVLTDKDGDYTAPEITRTRGADQSVVPVWKKFRQGCSGFANDTLVCFPGTAASVSIDMNWNQDLVHFVAPVQRGYWSFRYDLSTMTSVSTFTLLPSISVDTSIYWMRGDTVRVRFSNAFYRLVHNGPTAALQREEPVFFAGARVSGRRVEWSIPAGAAETLDWTLRDTQGAALRHASACGVRGALDLEGVSSGIYWLSFRGRSSGATRLRTRILLP